VCVSKLYVSKLCVNKVCVSKLYVSKLCVNKVCVSKLYVSKLEQWNLVQGKKEEKVKFSRHPENMLFSSGEALIHQTVCRQFIIATILLIFVLFLFQSN